METATQITPRNARRRTGLTLCLIAIASCALGAAVLRAQSVETNTAPMIHPGAVAIGVGASLESVETLTHARVELRASRFLPAPAGLFALTGTLGFTAVSGLYRLEAEAGPEWTVRIGASGAYPYLAAFGGVRQEWIGSFSAMRYTAGPSLGVHALVSPDAAFELRYDLRRVLHDPAADYWEQRLGVGLSLFVGNEGR